MKQTSVPERRKFDQTFKREVVLKPFVHDPTAGWRPVAERLAEV